MSGRREFTNRFDDYSSEDSQEEYLSSDGRSACSTVAERIERLIRLVLKLSAEWQTKIREKISELMAKLDRGLRTEVDFRDGSVYTGSAGIALLYYAIYKKLDRELSTEWLNKADEFVREGIVYTGRREASFLCGSAGAEAVAAVVYSKLNRNQEAEKHCRKVLEMANTVVQKASIPDELLFGRSGYLYSLMFLKRECPVCPDVDEQMRMVMEAIIRYGLSCSRKNRLSECPLLYVWHDTIYLGAAHGLAGIFFILMRTPMFNTNNEVKSLVEKSIDYLTTIRYPSGNYPSSLPASGNDKLVHWCHGAPGFVHMFLQAYKVYRKDVYMEEALSCGEVIWRRGLLRKGYGLCHGVAGNGYAFLMLYQATNDLRYLHRALKFAEFIFDYGKHDCRIADRPYSLFEGLAGTIYYLIDLLNPMDAAFPAFY